MDMEKHSLLRLLTARRANPSWEYSVVEYTQDIGQRAPYRWREIRPRDVLVKGSSRVRVVTTTGTVDDRCRLVVRHWEGGGGLDVWDVPASAPVDTYTVVRYGRERLWRRHDRAEVRLTDRGIVVINDAQGREYRMDPGAELPFTVDEVLTVLSALRLIRSAPV